MRSTVLFLAAFTFSGAVFAQQATVKTSGSMTTRVQPGNVQTTASGNTNAAVSGPAGNSAGISTSQVATGEMSGQQATSVDHGVGTTAGAVISHTAQAENGAAGLKTSVQQGVHTSTEVIGNRIQATGQQAIQAGTRVTEATAGVQTAAQQTLNAGSIGAQSGIQAAGQQTLKAGSGGINAQTNIHAAARQAVKVAAPVRMNTKISGGARLGVL